MRFKSLIICILTATLSGCYRYMPTDPQEFPILSWGGIPADKADTLFRLAKECGFNMHLGLYRAPESLLISLDAAQREGIKMIAGHPYIKDSTEQAVAALKHHPALFAYHLKDEPEIADFPWLKSLYDRVTHLDSTHPCYINLYPNWAWGEEEYVENIDSFASQFDLAFYSFDNYPIVEKDGKIEVRPEWYRNLEEFSMLAQRYNKPFWGFVLATSHSTGDLSSLTFYPSPTLGHIRMQVFSNLLYGAQGIQYFTYAGIVDVNFIAKKEQFDIIRKVNAEIKAYSPVFLGCEVQGVWHIGEHIPSNTVELQSMPDKKVRKLSVSGKGGVVSLIRNKRKTYLAIQNRDCEHSAILDIVFDSKVERITPDGVVAYDGNSISLDPGDIAVFRL